MQQTMLNNLWDVNMFMVDQHQKDLIVQDLQCMYIKNMGLTYHIQQQHNQK